MVQMNQNQQCNIKIIIDEYSEDENKNISSLSPKSQQNATLCNSEFQRRPKLKRKSRSSMALQSERPEANQKSKGKLSLYMLGKTYRWICRARIRTYFVRAFNMKGSVSEPPSPSGHKLRMAGKPFRYIPRHFERYEHKSLA